MHPELFTVIELQLRRGNHSIAHAAANIAIASKEFHALERLHRQFQNEKSIKVLQYWVTKKKVKIYYDHPTCNFPCLRCRWHVVHVEQHYDQEDKCLQGFDGFDSIGIYVFFET